VADTLSESMVKAGYEHRGKEILGFVDLWKLLTNLCDPDKSPPVADRIAVPHSLPSESAPVNGTLRSALTVKNIRAGYICCYSSVLVTLQSPETLSRVASSWDESKKPRVD